MFCDASAVSRKPHKGLHFWSHPPAQARPSVLSARKVPPFRRGPILSGVEILAALEAADALRLSLGVFRNGEVLVQVVNGEVRSSAGASF